MKKMNITTQHPGSSFGVPVILQGSMVVDYATGIKGVRQFLNLDIMELATLCGVSRRTVEGWEQGRMPTVAALNVMRDLLP